MKYKTKVLNNANEIKKSGVPSGHWCHWLNVLKHPAAPLLEEPQDHWEKAKHHISNGWVKLVSKFSGKLES